MEATTIVVCKRKATGRKPGEDLVLMAYSSGELVNLEVGTPALKKNMISNAVFQFCWSCVLSSNRLLGPRWGPAARPLVESGAAPQQGQGGSATEKFLTVSS